MCTTQLISYDTSFLHFGWSVASPRGQTGHRLRFVCQSWTGVKTFSWVYFAQRANRQRRRSTCGVIVCLFVYVPTGAHLGGKRDAIKAHTDQTHTHTHTGFGGEGKEVCFVKKTQVPTFPPCQTHTLSSSLENNDCQLKPTNRPSGRMLRCLQTSGTPPSEKPRGV